MVLDEHPRQPRRRGARRPRELQGQGGLKLGVLEYILQPEALPGALRRHRSTRSRIDYYPPRGDDKEGWDNIDIFGWLGYPMQMKINFLCRDSILAAPIVLDLALFIDLAQRASFRGIQEWLSLLLQVAP